MECTDPLVSVVIPTRNRPDLVVRAAHSALKQSLDKIEVIIVLDGPDKATLQVLHQIDDPRLRLRTLPQNLGVSNARNAGVSEARSQWIAFLDDDDEWFPQKIEIQLQAARESNYLYPIISCRVIARSEMNDFIWPRRFPRPNELLSEYMFCRKSPFFGEGIVPFNTVFTTKELLQMVPFKSGLRNHEDLDWLLRVSALEGVGVEFVARTEPLVIWHIEENLSRKSNRTDWCHSLAWIQTNKHLVTRRAYASFIMTWLGLHAARQRNWKAFLPLIYEACQHGKPAIIDFLSYFGIWLIPQKIKRQMVALLSKRYL